MLGQGREGIAPEDEALYRCELASAAMAVGDEETAFRALDGASRIMGPLESTSAENARAIFGQESTKTWKGDPYERCMNALYKGLLYWRRGDLDNASACFKRGLLADGWSEAGEHQRDFEALAYLLGWVSALRGEPEQAAFSFREAAELRPGNPWLVEARPDRFNVLVVADIGRGPFKYADGADGSLVRFARPPSEERGIEILVDGVPMGRSEPATDLTYQAITRGKRVLDGIRAGKAVFKTGTAVAGIIVLDEGLRKNKGELVALGAGLLLLSVLTRAEADTRCWVQLPAEIHVLPLSIDPGRRRLTVRALAADGAPIPGWERDFEVEVPPSPDTVYWFRTGLNRRIFGLTGPVAPAEPIAAPEPPAARPLQ